MSRIINFISCHKIAEVTREELAQLKDIERSLIGQWCDVLDLIGDEQNNLGTDDHKLVWL